MRHIEFLKCLEELLKDIPEKERESALLYYEGYFQDAGLENVEEVIRELGSPKKVAASIIEDDSFIEDAKFLPCVNVNNNENQEKNNINYNIKNQDKKKNNNWKLYLIIILTILAVPFLITILGLTRFLINKSIIENKKTDIMNWNNEASYFDEQLVSRQINSKIESLKLDIDYGEVYIKEGDKFSVELSGDIKKIVKIYEKNGLLSISCDKDYSKIFTFNLFTKNNWKGKKIIIIIPKEFSGENIDITLGAGKMEAKKLLADEISLDVGVGVAEVNELTSYKKMDLNAGTGEIKIKEIKGSNVSIDCGVGKIKVNDGTISGKNKISCGVGNIELKLAGNINNYNFYIDSGIGHVNINNDKNSFSSSSKKVSENATNEFRIDCGIGNIDIKIK